MISHTAVTHLGAQSLPWLIGVTKRQKVEYGKLSFTILAKSDKWPCRQLGSFRPRGPIPLAKKLEAVWRMDPHTQAKHTILRRYWEAWLPIMTKYNQRVRIIQEDSCNWEADGVGKLARGIGRAILGTGHVSGTQRPPVS